MHHHEKLISIPIVDKLNFLPRCNRPADTGTEPMIRQQPVGSHGDDDGIPDVGYPGTNTLNGEIVGRVTGTRNLYTVVVQE